MDTSEFYNLFELAFFGMYAAVLIGAAIGVIASRNPVHSAMFLVLAFVSSSVLWLMLEAEFLAMTLVLVYVGAVMVLFLFVVMMLDIDFSTLRTGYMRYAPVGILVALVAIAQIWSIIWLKGQGLPDLPRPEAAAADYSNTKELGAVLYTEHVYAFELASFILLLAIIAAIVLTMRRRSGQKVQDIGEQVSVRREDRLRIVKMDAETD
jgi:NADH-quinone oxidoreductase subunit J